jgi:hypothetical protein
MAASPQSRSHVVPYKQWNGRHRQPRRPALLVLVVSCAVALAQQQPQPTPVGKPANVDHNVTQIPHKPAAK